MDHASASPAPVDPPAGGRSGGSRARDRRGQVTGEERERLRRGFGAALWGERLRRGWPQAELARRAGLHPETISAYERGTIRPTDSACHKLARALVGDQAPALDVATCSAVLMIEAGESLRVVQRRRPRRQRWVRAYRQAAQQVAAGRADPGALDVALALIEPAPAPDVPPWPDARRPAVRP